MTFQLWFVDDVDDVPKDGRPPTKEELHQFFLPFRGFCARKGVSSNNIFQHSSYQLFNNHICIIMRMYILLYFIIMGINCFRSQQRNWSYMTLMFQVHLLITLL